MKKLLLSAFAVMALSASAQTFQVDGLQYTVTDATQKTVNLAKPSKAYAIENVVVPATVTFDGITYSVTGLADQAFMSNTTLKTIKLPDGLKSVGVQAFQGASNLTTVTFGTGLEEIKDKAFFTCTGVTELVIPNTCKSIGLWGLRGMSALITLVLPEELEAIPEGMCWANSKMKGLTVPDKVKYLGKSAFANCSQLDTIQLGEAVDSLGPSAFAYASGCKKFICKPAVPPTLADEKSIVTTVTKTELYVREKSLEVYQKTAPWSTFTTIKAYDPSGSADDKNFVMAGVGYEVISKDNATVGVCAIDTITYTGEIMVRPTVDYAGITFNVVAVQPNAFKNATGVTQIELPTSITSIGDNAFNGCSGMKYFVIKANTPPTLGTTVFSGINMTTAKLFVEQAGATAYKTADQWKDFTNRSIVIDAVTVDGLSYKCNNIIESTLDFTGAKGVAGSLVIPDTVMVDGYPFTVTGIAGNSFYGTGKITALTLPSTLKIIYGSAFYTLGDYSNPIKEIIVPEGVTSIGSNAFYGAHVQHVELPKKSLTNLANSAFYSCDIDGIEIPGSVGIIRGSTFYGSKMSWVILGEGITEVQDNAFFGTKIGALRLPSTMRVLGPGAFSACNALSSVTFNEGLDTVAPTAFGQSNAMYKLFNFSTKEVPGLTAALSDSGEKLGNERTTYSVVPLNGVMIWGKVNVRSDLASWFDQDGIRYLPASAGSTDVTAVDGSYLRNDVSVKLPASFTKDGKTYNVKDVAKYLLCGQGIMNDVDVTMPLKEVPAGFVYYSPKVKSVKLPNTVTTIGQYAFSFTDSLATVTLPEGLTSLGLAAFYYSGVKELTIPGTVTLCDNASLSGCRRLTNITFADGKEPVLLGWMPTMFGNRPILTGSKLEKAVIGRDLNYYTGPSYGYSPFYGDSIIQSVVFTDAATTVGTSLFLDCKGMKYATLGNGVKNIGASAFSGCAALDSCFLGEGLLAVGANAFTGCTAMTKLYSGSVAAPVCSTAALTDINKDKCTLFVPKAAIAAYKAAAQWKDFLNVQAYPFVGVDVVIGEGNNGRYVVYNLNGTLVLDTTDESLVENLPAGLYIINGKKVIK